MTHDKKMKIIFLGYREWALKSIDILCGHSALTDYKIFTNHEEFISKFESGNYKDYIIIAIGWSWILRKDITLSNLCLGVHPSDLPYYRGGSPLQNQILDGITNTKLSLFQLTHNLDEGDIYGKCELSLMGDSMSEIFKNLELKTVSLVNKFFDAYPNVEIRKQKKIGLKTLNRRKASDSKIDFEDFNEENLLNLYNKIRCLTDPYPNAFMADKQGNKLFFESIKFEKKD